MAKGGEARKSAVLAVALMACYAANMLITVQLRRQTGIDALWTSNAFLIGALVLLPRWWGVLVAIACCGIQFNSTWRAEESIYTPMMFSSLNVVEAAAIAFLVRHMRLERLTTPGRVAKLVLVAMIPALLLFTVVWSSIVHIALDRPFLDSFLNRLPAKALGIIMVLPGVLLLAKHNSMPFPRGRMLEALGCYLAMAALSCALFTSFAPAALFLMFPAITMLGLRLGPRAVILSVLMSAALIFPAGMVIHPGVMFDADWTMGKQILMMQVFMAAVFFTGLTTALSSMHQERLRKLFAKRTESAMRSRDRAKAASRAKSEFLATMSHEIRTPLNSIIGFAQVLDRRDDLPAEARRQVALVERAGGSLLTVVNDILDFSKVEEGQLELDPKPVRLEQVAEEALAIVAGVAEQKGLHLSLITEGAGGAHVIDDHRLRQILLNFLNNAVKFTDTGSVRLCLEVTPGEERDRARFTVIDSGVGISPEAQARLFRRFSQVDGSISRSHGGSGLGLAICKGLAEVMGGEVGVESEPGKGSAFFVEFELERAEDAAGSEAAMDEAQGLGAHVLLVDDHPMNRELGQTVLGLLGCTCDVAADGREAIEAAKLARYDAILMDVHMPGIDGLAATRAIRALGGAAGSVPIIAMSADVLPEHVERCRAAGMVDSVGKPINIEALHDCLERWIGRTADGETVKAA